MMIMIMMMMMSQLSFCCMGVCTMLMVTAQDAGDYRYKITGSVYHIPVLNYNDKITGSEFTCTALYTS